MLLSLLIGQLGSAAKGKGLLKKLSREQISKRMEDAEPIVVRDMAEDGLDRSDPLRDQVRGAMFRLWREALRGIPGAGHVADLFRDRQEAKVLELVEARKNKPSRLIQDMPWLVKVVRESILEVTF